MKPSDLHQTELNKTGSNKNANRKKGGLVGGSLPMGRLPMGSLAMGSLPMEWMDPMSWRLPSGKALAEFALQAGCLAPLILSGPRGQATAENSNGAAADNSESTPRPVGYGKAPVSTR